MPKAKTLKQEVAAIIKSHVEHGYTAKDFIAALREGGCQSGLVGSLIYYTDTCAFFARHRSEIGKLLAEALGESGCRTPAELFGDKWADEDPLADDTQNQNLLAWFAFEETAFALYPEQ
jgi:hypothetical protein